MCFNKSSSSAATSSNTTNRDERIGAEGGAIVGSAKDGAELTQTVAHTEEAENVFSLAPNAVLNFESTTPEVVEASYAFAGGASDDAFDFASGALDKFLDFASGASSAANNLVSQTQSAYQEAAAEAATQDTTEISRDVIKYAALAVVAVFAFQYLGKVA